MTARTAIVSNNSSTKLQCNYYTYLKLKMDSVSLLVVLRSQRLVSLM